ncbi:hypothetical protein FN846DRAFT_913973 [Sphaerosporella brunnea]|uniref:F-box domain-containing protein n=1 Tax=Sphaerosporella brunnea TaxID=1250544 RepID=A0A5J5EE39_9PEZI|nr:hypothetical protein FN846DRAFT_913973 [Sphaerosporella brunnea]
MSALKRRLRRDFSPEDSEQELFESAPKRHRPNRTAPILHLSDELFLRIASHLQTRDLAAFQLVSHRCSRIAVDSQIWKKLYYHRFVRPRASRIPGLGRAQLGDYASRRSIWLEDEGIAREVGTNWKAQYRLRHNWGNGTCGIRKIDISGKEGDASDLLVKLFEGIVFAASPTQGLRAWRLRNHDGTSTDDLIANTSLYSNMLPYSRVGAPSAIAVDGESGGASSHVNVTVGFRNGAFAMYQLDRSQRESTFRRAYTHAPSSSSSSSNEITAIASLGPYLSVYAGQDWDIYEFPARAEGAADDGCNSDAETSGDDNDPDSISTNSRNPPSRMIHRDTPHDDANDDDAPPTPPPRVLASLHSAIAWPPTTLSLRRSINGTLLASIVHTTPLYRSGWAVGMQELRFTTASSSSSSSSSSSTTLAESRIASSVPTRFVSGVAGSQEGYDPPLAQPTCLSYCHPYLLLSHGDNTLTLHLVHSSTNHLRISPGQRLYGHTSGVSSVLVDARGKAVSISRQLEEMRVWELEGGVRERRRESASVLVQQQGRRRGEGTLAGFDEERVVALVEDGVRVGVWDFSQ